MLHPIFSTVLGHPDLIAEHVANYAALVEQEAQQAGRGFTTRLMAGVLAAASAMLALGLIGVAVMLGALHGFHSMLVVVPGIAVLIAIISAYLAARPIQLHPFADLRMQFDADLRALRAAGARRDE
ncbi:MAG: hypothetical protein EOP82_14975 [Variovorax sp.]|nr:MAG: hypothetical protein EOP82_14975 [Variovorax sp.]